MVSDSFAVVQYGLGPIGIACVRQALKKPGLRIMGAVDIDPEKTGRPLEEILGVSDATGVVVRPTLREALQDAKADVALHTTQSSLKAVLPQLEELARQGINVVSSTEELLIPELQSPPESEYLDRLARDCGVTILGTGVNPGFVMDTLPLFFSSLCLEIRAIRVRRELDASKRRFPLQKKVGSGITVEEFADLKSQKKIGHVGFVESLAMILKGLDWNADEVTETLDPVIAPEELRTAFFVIPAGHVCGIRHIARAIKNGREIVTLDLRMYSGAPESYDLVEIDGTPPIRVKTEGGIPGDEATVAALVNALPRVVCARPGLVTMRDLRLPCAFQAFMP